MPAPRMHAAPARPPPQFWTRRRPTPFKTLSRPVRQKTLAARLRRPQRRAAARINRREAKTMAQAAPPRKTRATMRALHPSDRDDHRPDRSLRRPAAAYDLTAGGAVRPKFIRRRQEVPFFARNIAVLGQQPHQKRRTKPGTRRPILTRRSQRLSPTQMYCNPSEAATSRYRDDRAARRPMSALAVGPHNEFDDS